MKRSFLLEQTRWPDPYTGFEPLENPENLKWHFDAAFLTQVYRRCPEPELMVEVGTWLGNSAIAAAHYYRKYLNWHDFTLICVDTWLGSVEHWLRDADHPTRQALHMKHGRPQLYDHFLSHVIKADLTDHIQPLPQTSMNGARILGFFKEKFDWAPDWVYIDASHETLEVFIDMDMYYALLNSGGILCGDDWNWPSVRKAVVDFAIEKKLEIFNSKYSWGLIKP